MSALADAGLNEAGLGQDWIRAGDQALTNAMTATLPFQEAAYFPADRASATAYRVDLRRGRRLVVDVSVDAVPPATVFVDLFEARDGEPARRVAALDSPGAALTHDIDRDGTYLLRLQPELLRSGRFRINARTESRITFPVQDSSARDVASSFSAARDAGRREHEGVDIFAPRGTAVLAVVDGIAQSGTNALGGNVVWLRGALTGPRYYYAHLERWEVDGTVRVPAGGVVGYVGNTGNARTTAPHLHFGIYDDRAIDPMPFLQPDDDAPEAPSADESVLGVVARVTTARAAMRAGTKPAQTMSPRQLERGTIVRVVGASARSYRVRLPDTSEGYVDASAVARADTPLRRERVGINSALLEAPRANAPVMDMLGPESQIEILGQFGSFRFVRAANQRSGWLETRK